jgi:endonuclease/exonuclease/phosphatase family metal-dependent hydrolase
LREGWNDCYGVVDSGSDCLTRKGFTQSRVDFGEGAELHVFNVHMDAGRGTGDLRARAANFTQLLDAIGALPPGAALIVAGDFNERYRDASGNYPRLLQDTGLRDAWVEFVFGGVMPDWSALNAVCGSDPDDPGCERIDKVFFRGSDALALALMDYRVEGARFVDPDGMQLSDHRPVAAVFELSRPEDAERSQSAASSTTPE